MIAITKIGIARLSPATVNGPICNPPRAREVPSATPSRITGNAQRMSINRERALSVQAAQVAGEEPDQQAEQRS